MGGGASGKEHSRETNEEVSEVGERRRVWRVLSCFGAVLLTLAAAGCGDGDRAGAPPSDNDPEVGAEPPGTTFFFDPARFIGRDVTVTGYVSEVLNPFAFRIAGERIEGPGVLVVSNQPLDLDDDDLVQVTGRARWFHVEEFVQELDVTLDPVTFHALEGEVAIATHEVTVNGTRDSQRP